LSVHGLARRRPPMLRTSRAARSAFHRGVAPKMRCRSRPTARVRGDGHRAASIVSVAAAGANVCPLTAYGPLREAAIAAFAKVGDATESSAPCVRRHNPIKHSSPRRVLALSIASAPESGIEIDGRLSAHENGIDSGKASCWRFARPGPRPVR
jgi:hypothetical protein